MSVHRPACKMIFVTGGVVSSLGKGILSASLGCCLKSSGSKVGVIKLDPYLNIDPGTMSPHEHGEVFVTEDGGETDLDLGHYERFLLQPMGKKNNVTAGRIYRDLLDKERQGAFEGKTVQTIPHVTEAIQSAIFSAAEGHEVLLVEVGGTVGDIEALPFLVAVQRIAATLPAKSKLHIHLTWLLMIPPSSVLKTKPTQHSLKELRSLGIEPDILACRSERFIEEEEFVKLMRSCGMARENLWSIPHLASVYDLPIAIHDQGYFHQLAERLELPNPPSTLQAWRKWRASDAEARSKEGEVSVAIVAKYSSQLDVYRSLYEALLSSSVALHLNLKLHWVDAASLEEEDEAAWGALQQADAILVAGGFGPRGVEGKISAATYAYRSKTPYLGICLGMQVGLIALSRELLGEKEANSTEFDLNTPYPVVSLVREWKSEDGSSEYREETDALGGTLRLGAQPCHLEADSKIALAYGKLVVYERHRHRYEVKEPLIRPLEAYGLIVSGRSFDGRLVETVELKDHPWWIGCQYHPEFTANPIEGHPLFIDFLKKAVERKEGVLA